MSVEAKQAAPPSQGQLGMYNHPEVDGICVIEGIYYGSFKRSYSSYCRMALGVGVIIGLFPRIWGLFLMARTASYTTDLDR